MYAYMLEVENVSVKRTLILTADYYDEADF